MPWMLRVTACVSTVREVQALFLLARKDKVVNKSSQCLMSTSRRDERKER